MPKETVVLTEFIEGHQSEKSGKWVPAKVKDNRGRDFTFSKDDKGKRLTDGGIVGFIGELADIEFTESQNGKFTNRVISEIAHRQEPGPQPAMATPPPAEKPQGSGWKRDPAESSLILRQVALKAAVEYVRDHDLDSGTIAGTGAVVAVAEAFNDWLRGLPVSGQNVASPEQRAAKEALNTGGSYAEALSKQKPHVAATLPAGKNLADLAREAVANHNPLAEEEVPPPWVDETKPTRESVGPRGTSRR